jgi:hypothetical protein
MSRDFRAEYARQCREHETWAVAEGRRLRRRVWWSLCGTVIASLAGVTLAAFAFHVTDERTGWTLFYGGMFVTWGGAIAVNTVVWRPD